MNRSVVAVRVHITVAGILEQWRRLPRRAGGRGQEPIYREGGGRKKGSLGLNSKLGHGIRVSPKKLEAGVWMG